MTHRTALPLASKSCLVVAQLGAPRHGKTAVLANMVSAMRSEAPDSVTVLSVLAKGNRFIEGRRVRAPLWKLEAGYETQRAWPVFYETRRHRVAHFDGPGRREFLPELLRILHEVDVAVVVVSARLSIQKETREHLYLARCLGVADIIVILQDSGDCSAEHVDAAECAARDALDEAGWPAEETPVLRTETSDPGSSTWRTFVRRFCDLLDARKPRFEADLSRMGLMWADDTFKRDFDSSEYMPMVSARRMSINPITCMPGPLLRSSKSLGTWMD